MFVRSKTRTSKLSIPRRAYSQYGGSETCHLQYNSRSGRILGVSEACFKHFGLKPDFFNKIISSNIPTMDLIGPEIMDRKNFGKLISPTGLVCSLDTTVLNKNVYLLNLAEEHKNQPKNGRFGVYGSGLERSSKKLGALGADLVDESQDGLFGESEISDSEDKEGRSLEGLFGDIDEGKLPRRFRKAQIRAWVEQEDHYTSEKILTLRFILVEDGVDSRDEGVMVEEVDEVVAVGEEAFFENDLSTVSLNFLSIFRKILIFFTILTLNRVSYTPISSSNHKNRYTNPKTFQKTQNSKFPKIPQKIQQPPIS